MSNSEHTGKGMRLNRFVSKSGVASRRKAETIIAAGRITVNDDIVTDPARNVIPGKDVVTIDGGVITAEAGKRYMVLNKPTGVIVSVGDTHGRKTVMNIIGGNTAGLFPVGRLDLFTSGVLLVTDDGDLAHRLMHPSYGVEKTYRAQVKGLVGDDAIRSFHKGIELDDGMTAPAKLNVLERTDTLSIVEVTLHQGRKRQVRRMFDAVGHPVRTLDRISFGGITAEGLKRGKHRPLVAEEVAMLKQAVKLKK